MQLTDTLTDAFRLTKGQQAALKKLRIETVRDLLYHFPSRYENISSVKRITDLRLNDEAIIYGRLEGLRTRKAWRSKRPIAEGYVRDESGRMKIIWFNQPYLAKMHTEGMPVKVVGRVGGSAGKLYLPNPDVEHIEGLPLESDDSLFESSSNEQKLFSIYPESAGITSKWFYYTIRKILSARDDSVSGGKSILDHIEDPIPKAIRDRYRLPALATALVWIHTPQKEADAESARKRFAFEEIFYIQLARHRDRVKRREKPSFRIRVEKEDLEDFILRFPFQPTQAQRKAIDDILADFQSPSAMARLLEGDVGSGKTAVAATTVYAVATTPPLREDGEFQDFGRLQTAYMCPTEILAKQHFESFIQFFRHEPARALRAGGPINIGLITSSGYRKFPSKVNKETWTDISRTQLLKWIANGEIPVLIGTHALIQKTVQFENLAYVIIDEQHRFGTAQRQTLVRGQTQNERGENAEENNDSLLYRELTYKIREAFFAVQKTLGSGHKESVYHNALIEAFSERSIPFSREVRMPVKFGKKTVGTYVPDFVIDNKVVIELKALPFIGTSEKRQLWNYLKGSEYKLGLLVNFGTKELSIERVVYDSARNKSVSTTPHHFGVRSASASASIPHLLSMTATPIPRTLALTIYGDLDLTLLDEMPHGRKPIITEVVFPKDRAGTYEKVRTELGAGRQAYVICPRIDSEAADANGASEPSSAQKIAALQMKSVKEESARLKRDVFPEYAIEYLHSKMTPKEKETVMQNFLEKKIDILVATSVVEVGVNVPNATVIIIEGAERFGLAQLHQLRGRVIRSNDQAYCYVFSESRSKKTQERLVAFKKAKNGFELAEHDLKLRGAGELAGRSQSGLSDIGMEALKNLKIVEAARAEAQTLIEADVSLDQYPLLNERITQKQAQLHFE